jgi:carbonic anhydrase
MKFQTIALTLLFLGLYTLKTVGQEHAGISGDEALKKLLDGNKRYVAVQLTHPDQNKERLAEVAKGQHPFAIILGCSDSRVPPEIIFDQGIGDLFIIRVAGNITDDITIGSIEYAVEHLGVKLIVVLGHEKCGAVDATVKGGEAPGHIKSLIDAIKPAVEKAKAQTGDVLDNAIRNNVEIVVNQLKSSAPILKEATEKGLKIVGARYDLDEGSVDILK